MKFALALALLCYTPFMFGSARTNDSKIVIFFHDYPCTESKCLCDWGKILRNAYETSKDDFKAVSTRMLQKDYQRFYAAFSRPCEGKESIFITTLKNNDVTLTWVVEELKQATKYPGKK